MSEEFFAGESSDGSGSYIGFARTTSPRIGADEPLFTLTLAGDGATHLHTVLDADECIRLLETVVGLLRDARESIDKVDRTRE